MTIRSDKSTSPIELLAPAGDLVCARAAVENGADAIYFGLDEGLNARARATNISLGNLDELMDLVHGRGVNGYLTLNTLVFPGELSKCSRIITEVAQAGVDAVLVQDLGVARLVREICPEMSVHASTQMTLTSAECIKVAAEVGIDRVVLARELSISEIKRIAAESELPLEVFCHGALCVAYSGQCLTSESLGGRSANRGQCAQACRLPYDLMCDGEDVELEDVKYLLSPQDLAAFELIPELIEAGVISFKIEGRLKTPEYVANVTRHYRQAIDSAIATRAVHLDEQKVEEMELSFSRGFSPGWLSGCDHKMLVPGLSSSKRGVLLGQIQEVGKSRVKVELSRSLKVGDGIVFDGDRAANEEQGGRVFEIFRQRQSVAEAAPQQVVELAFRRQTIDFSDLFVGQQLWKTDDPQLTRRLKKSFSGKPQRRVPINVSLRAAVGEPLQVQIRAPGGRFVECRGEDLLNKAEKHPATTQNLKEQIDRLGQTVYQLEGFEAEIVDAPMVPLSLMGKLRKQMVETLNAALRSRPVRKIYDRDGKLTLEDGVQEPSTNATALTVLCRSLSQLNQLLEMDCRNVVADFADIREYAQATKEARQTQTQLLLATPRIHKPSENGIFRKIAAAEPDGILVRNLAGIDFFSRQKLPVYADFALNVSNQWTAEFIRKLDVRRITVSYDLNRDQVFELVDAIPSAWLEVVIHQHMPMFHMEHCVFCAVLSPGTNKTNCGRPCDVHEVHLRDRVGMEHLLTADVGCRNTLFNAQPQSAAEIVPELTRKGVSAFRVELLGNETPQTVELIISLYQDLLDGRTDPGEVWKRLKASNRVGVTRGTMETRRDPLAIL